MLKPGQQLGVARIAANVVQQRVELDVHQTGVADADRALQPFECGVVIADPGLDLGTW